ncbi:MAG: class I SAM-dependent methyltransferase [Propioniciclava sp.]
MSTDFDAKAATWDTPEKIESSQKVAAAIQQAVPLVGTWVLLDYGAGTGLVGEALSHQVAQVIFADTSAGMRAEAAKRAARQPDKLSVIDHDLSVAPLAAPVDCLVSSMALHHIPDTQAVVNRMVASLRPGGWLALVDLAPDPDNTFHDDDHAGHRGIESDTLLGFLHEAGLVELTENTFMTINREKDGIDYPQDVFLVAGHLP